MYEYRFNLGCGHNRIKDFINLDIKRGWTFQKGLPDYPNESTDGITISHALMYINERELSVFLREAYRLLIKGGVIRITEDNTEHPQSDTFKKGWRGSKCLTGPKMMRTFLEKAGFEVFDLTNNTTKFIDNSLMQNNGHEHDNPLRVFYIEGRK